MQFCPTCASDHQPWRVDSCGEGLGRNRCKAATCRSISIMTRKLCMNQTSRGSFQGRGADAGGARLPPVVVASDEPIYDTELASR
jgi:hypothetical protein